jgi:FlaA1/EpsC-like NDP-sugar epimerase
VLRADPGQAGRAFVTDVDLGRSVVGLWDSSTARPSRLAAVAPAARAVSSITDSLPARSSRIVCLLVVVDAVSVALAVALSYVGRYGTATVPGIDSRTGWPVFVLVGLVWLGSLWAQRAYEPRLLGVGTDEYGRVTRATLLLFSALAIGSYLLKFELARGFVALALPVGLVLLLAGRFTLRQWIRHERAAGKLCHRVLVVGESGLVADFAEQLRAEPAAGFAVVGACLPTDSHTVAIGPRLDPIPVLGDYTQVPRAARDAGADVVAVTASESFTPERLRRLAWSLEGQDVNLVVAPAVTEVAGPRVTVRPVAGLPLMYVDEPRFTGFQRILKGTLDRVVAATG